MVTVLISRLEPYPSDLSDEQWTFLIQKFPSLEEIPNFRRLLNAVWYKCVLRTDWSFLPRDFPLPKEAKEFFLFYRRNGLLQDLVSYLGSYYTLSKPLVRGLKAEGFNTQFDQGLGYTVEFGERIYLR